MEILSSRPRARAGTSNSNRLLVDVDSMGGVTPRLRHVDYNRRIAVSLVKEHYANLVTTSCTIFTAFVIRREPGERPAPKRLTGSKGTLVMAVQPVRSAASGPCRCSRHTCWHARDCRSSGVIRILRISASTGESSSSVVLCRECAAPTQRNRVA
jgi:hypothetical protein